jgi:hypothetical protein
MALLEFPPNPSNGIVYPPGPGEPGKIQWIFDSALGAWNVVPSVLSTGNQAAFNEYVWPEDDGNASYQLTTAGNGELSWEAPSAPALQHLELDTPFDGIDTEFTMYRQGTTTPFTPAPLSNLVVFLGGVPQIPGDSYTVAGSVITFSEAPPAGASFYAISSINS